MIESALAFQPHVIVSGLLLVLVGVMRLSEQVFEQARDAGFDVVFAEPTDVDALKRHRELA